MLWCMLGVAGRGLNRLQLTNTFSRVTCVLAARLLLGGLLAFSASLGVGIHSALLP